MSFRCCKYSSFMVPCSTIACTCSPIYRITYLNRTHLSWGCKISIPIYGTCQISQTIRTSFNHSVTHSITIIVENHLIR